MRLTVLGCSGSYPGPDSPASSYLLQADGPDGSGGTRTWRVLLDLGNGALGSLQRHIDPHLIDGVFLSHLHADHCLDLCGLYVVQRFHPSGTGRRIPVWGPPGVAGRMARAYDLPAEPGMTGEFAFSEYASPGEPVELGPFQVTPHPVVHPVPAYALRVRCGDRVLTYSGDTAPCDALDEAARGADLLLCEASFRTGEDNPPGLHLTGAEAGAVAARADVRRLLLTHVPPWYEADAIEAEAASEYGGDLSLARMGLVRDV